MRRSIPTQATLLSLSLKTASTLFLATLLLFGISGTSVQAQNSVRFISQPAAVQPNASQERIAVVDVLKSGAELEQKGLWGDALLLYERAEKEFGSTNTIKQKLFNARTHFDVQRRYADANYVRSIRTTSLATTQNIFSEVLHKIETHYVKQPEWVALVRQGLANVDVAIYEPSFQQENKITSTEATLNYAYQRIHQIAQKFRVGNRKNAYDFAMSIAQSLETDLNLPRSVTLFEFINGATTALDPYSSFLTGDQYAEIMSQIDGNFVGLGVEIRPKRETLQIISIIPGGPAAKSGLKKGDFILAIDQQEVKQIGGDQGADLLKGTAGSQLQLKIKRGEQVFSMNIMRQRVDIPSLRDVAIIDKSAGIGYIKLVNFQKNTAQSFESALWQLHRQGMKSLIVDVRGNPGGLLTASVDVADLFVPNGVLVSTKGRNPREDFIHQARQNGTWANLPLTVLVDRDSASASEIFAGAIRDLRRGTVVGETSYGKGSVQGIFPLTMGKGGIRLTTAKFYSPSGQAISDRGVKPDVQVYSTQKPAVESGETVSTGGSSDQMLRAAISVARQKTLQGKAG